MREIGPRAFSNLETFVERALLPGVLLLLFLLALPFVTGVSGSSSFVLGAMLAVVGCGLALVQRPALRRFALSLFVWSFAIRLVALLALSAIPGYDHTALLGPDSASYYRSSQTLAAGDLPASPTAYDAFGSLDVAHYYLFAGAIAVFHVDLFGLQLLNGALSALTALLSYLLCRGVLPSHAALTGVVVACGPTLIVMSVTDLLKDPSIVLATVLALWAMARLLGASRWISAAAWGVLAVAAFAYLRMDRFYVAAYLEAAVLVVMLVLLARRVKLSPAPTVVLALTLLAAEAGPMALGWPSSPVAIINNVLHVTQSPGIRDYPPGIVERSAKPDVSPSALDNNGPLASVLPLPVRETTTNLLAPVADIFRRLYGPLIWVPPPDLRVATIFRGDYILYPGMLVWYALLPLMLVGVAVVLWRWLAMRTTEIVLPAIAIFLAVYLAQYLAINLSYRQREDVLPLLVVFLPFGIALWSRLRHRWIVYGAYWLALLLVAVAHVAVRAPA